MERSDNFHLARVLAATMVVYGHSFALTRSQHDVVWYDSGIDAFAVRIFFVISGYLICKSWNSDPSLRRYLAKRCLRIFPGLIVVVLLAVCVLGPILTTLSLSNYARCPMTHQYLWNILLAPRFQLPGVFAANPYRNAINGSLWTLPAEFLMYLLLPIYASKNLAVCRNFLFPSALLTSFLLSFYFTLVASRAHQPIFYWSSLPQIARWAPYFLEGAAFAFWRIERLLRLDVAIVMIGFATCLPPANTVLQSIGLLFFTPYVVLAFCLPQNGGIAWFDNQLDLSYGTYLYAFPVQQSIIYLFGGKVSPIAIFAFSIPFAYGFGFLSWKLIEKPALAMKPWRPHTAKFLETHANTHND